MSKRILVKKSTQFYLLSFVMSLTKVLLFSASGLASTVVFAQVGFTLFLDSNNSCCYWHVLTSRYFYLIIFFLSYLPYRHLLYLILVIFLIIFIIDPTVSFSQNPHYPVYCKKNGYCHVPGLPDSCTNDHQCQTPWYPSSYCQSGGSCHLEPPPQCKTDADCNPPGVAIDEIERVVEGKGLFNKSFFFIWPFNF